MDKNFRGFFASALIFSVLASGCSDNSVSSDLNSDSTSSISSASSADDINNDESKSVSSIDSDGVQAIQLSVSSGNYASDLTDIFSNNDLNPSYTAENEITLNGSSATIKGKGSVNGSDILITDGGTYRISGTLDDGQIIVNSEEKVWLILDGADIHCSDSAPIYIESADKVFITLAENSVNKLSDDSHEVSTDDNEPDAVIFSKDNLTINGNGTLNIEAKFNEGITSKDDITITGGIINITSVGNGIKGKDCVAITTADINIDSQSDGIKSSNSNDEGKGFIFIYDGNINITSGEDAIQAEQELIIDGGNINVTSGGGSSSENVKEHSDDAMSGGGFGGFNKQNNSSSTTDSDVSMKGLKSGGNIYINGGIITADCADDSLHSSSELTILGGNLTLSSGDDGIHADEKISIIDGNIDIITSYEGIEAAIIEVSGGEIELVASDDGFNASDGSGGMMMGGFGGSNSSDVYLTISGGNIYVDADGDGLDSNGALYIKGGTTIVDGPTSNDNGALDSETGISIEGGILVAVGSNGMPEYPDEDSSQQFLAMTVNNQKANTAFTICDADGNEVITYEPSKTYASIIVSTPELSADTDYTLYTGSSSSSEKTHGLYTTGGYNNDGTKSDSTYQTNDAPSGFGGGGMSGGMGGGFGGSGDFGGGGDFGGDHGGDDDHGGDHGDMSMPDDFDFTNIPDDFDPSSMTPPDGFNAEDFANGDFSNMTPPDGANNGADNSDSVA